jgi:hypothetical protein
VTGTKAKFATSLMDQDISTKAPRQKTNTYKKVLEDFDIRVLDSLDILFKVSDG